MTDRPELGGRRLEGPRPAKKVAPRTVTPLRERVISPREQLRGKTIGPKEGIVFSDAIYTPGEFPIGYGPEPDDFNSIPNYEKLSRKERWIFDRLPGFAESGLGQTLAKFAESQFGKVLQYLDIGAEALERLVGFGSQALVAVGTEESWRDFTGNMSEAWYAGSLTVDMTNLPIYADGRFNLPTELPGIDGIVKARKDIVALVNAGVDPSEALVQVRDNYYNDLGALALRAQIHDAWFHIAADPLNVVLGYYKPFEKIKVATIMRLNKGALPEDIAHGVTKLTEIMQATEDVERVAEVQKAIDFIQNVDQLTPAHQRLLQLMGELPIQNPALQKTLGLPVIKTFKKLFELTPEARTSLLTESVTESVLSRIVGVLDDPEDIMTTLSRVADGTLGPEFGHMVVSVQGRSVRSAVQKMEVDGLKLLEAWTATGNERNLLNFVGDLVGQDSTKVFRMIKEGNEAAVFTQFMEAVEALGDDAVRALDEMLLVMNRQGAFDATALRSIVEIFGDTPLLNTSQFKTLLTTMIAESTMRQAIIQFGIKARGFIPKMAGMVKQAENLAFLRLNPGYPIRNFINGEWTMLARGAWGGFGIEGALEFFKELGFEPLRLRSGLGPAEISSGILTAAEATVPGQAALKAAKDVLASATAGERGFMGKVTTALKNVNLGVFDTGVFAAKTESWQSIRSFTSGYKRFWAKFRKVVKLADVDDVAARGFADLHGETALKRLTQKFADARTLDEIDELVFADNLLMSERAIIGDATERLGFDIYDVIEAEEAGTYANRIMDAAPKGTSAIRSEVKTIKRLVQEKLQADADNLLQDLIEQTENKVTAEALGALPRVALEQVDEFGGIHKKHVWDMQDLSTLARSQATQADAHRVFMAIQEREGLVFARAWDRGQARMQAISGGVKKIINQLDDAGKLTPEARIALRGFERETVGRFKSWRKVWDTFYKEKNAVLNRFFEDVIAKKKPLNTWDEVEQLGMDLYNKAIDDEFNILREMDEIFSATVADAERPLYNAWRESVAKVRRADHESVLRFRESIRGLSEMERKAAHDAFTTERLANLTRIIEEEKAGFAALQGDAAMKARYAGATAQLENELELIRKLVAGETLEIEDAVVAQEALLRNMTPEEIERVSAIGVAEEALEEGQAGRIEELATIQRAVLDRLEGPPQVGIDIPSIPDLNSISPDELFAGIGYDQLWFNKGDDAIEAMGEAARNIAREKPLKWTDLDAPTQAGMRKWIEAVKGQLSDDRHMATQYGAWMRDSGLLNYNRRKNYNTFLGVFFPYEFWMTQSAWKWLVHSVDRPAMISSYFKMEKFMRTAFRPERGRPSRLEGNVRVKMPLLPEWMGEDIFIDPLRTMLPFKQFLYPFERYEQEQQNHNYAVERVLREMVNDGDMNQNDYEAALMSRQGPDWDRAVSLARLDDTEARLNPFDFMSMMTAPHAPLMWAYNAARGKPEEIGPFLPITRSIKGVTALLGIGPNGGVNIEGAIRRELGLPEFDQWDDYRIDRMLTNMAAMGEITTEEALRAMIDRSGPVFEEGERKSGLAYGLQAMGSTLGMPIKAYPEGEERLREARDRYEQAWADYERTGEYDQTIGRFKEENPGYEARLALWKSPEERLRTFLKDEIWDAYNDLPELNRYEIKEQLGNLFTEVFLPNDRESIQSIPLDTLGVWLRYMGGDAPGQLSEATPLPFEKLTDPNTAHRMDAFYNTRTNTFQYYEPGGVRELTNKYFMLEKDARKEYLRHNPLLKQYWDWRKDFMLRNPDLAPYIEDDPDKRPLYEDIRQLEAALAAQPSYSPQEWQNILGVPLFNLILMEGPLPSVAQERLERIANELGVDVSSILNQLELTR